MIFFKAGNFSIFFFPLLFHPVFILDLLILVHMLYYTLLLSGLIEEVTHAYKHIPTPYSSL